MLQSRSRTLPQRLLCEYPVDDVPVDIGKPNIPPGEVEGEFGVVEAQQV